MMPDSTAREPQCDQTGRLDTIARLQAVRRRLAPLVAESHTWKDEATVAMLATMRADRTGQSWVPASRSLDAAQVTLSDVATVLFRIDVRIDAHRRAVQAIDDALCQAAAASVETA